MGSPCDPCFAACCREYHIVVDAVDFGRIASTLGLPPEDFVELKARPESRGDYRIRLSALDGEEPAFFRMTLRKVPDESGEHVGRCLFLLTVGGRGRCGIYGVRPSPCALYPTALEEGLLTVEGGRRTQFCPPGSWSAARVDVPAHRLGWSARRRNEAVTDALIAAWNARVVGDRVGYEARHFLQFLLGAYQELVRRAPALVGAASGEALPADASEGSLRATVAAAIDEVVAAIGWPRAAAATAPATMGSA